MIQPAGAMFGSPIEWSLALVLTVSCAAQAQWVLQDAHTDADLRGIASVGQGVAWASGTKGTVLKTADGGRVWQRCAIPADAEKLDFRGVQAVDERRAWVMSSGPGGLSRVYETADGCRTWKLLFTNPDAEGFWDAMVYQPKLRKLWVLGDPVAGDFVVYQSEVDGGSWSKLNSSRSAGRGQAAFAASNSILLVMNDVLFVTGGSRSEMVRMHSRTSLPFAAGESSGAFSIATDGEQTFVVVGGDYKRPGERGGTAAFSTDGGYRFSSAEAPPSGYRSAVAYTASLKAWIAVGPNGSDISRDGGRHWSALRPADGNVPETSEGWNALSLPFVAGPDGRIGKLSAVAR